MSNTDLDPFEDDEEEEDDIELCLNYNNTAIKSPKNKIKKIVKNPKKCLWVSPELHKLIKAESIKTGAYMQNIAKEAFENRLKK